MNSSPIQTTGVWSRLVDSFTAEGRNPGSAFRFGMLMFILSLLAFQAWWMSHLSPSYPYDRYSGGVMGIMLLLNHLAYAFHWPRTARIALRVSAWLWIGFGLFYLAHLSHVLFPA